MAKESSPNSDSNTSAAEPAQPSLLASYLAGGIGGLIVECAYFPLDTLKTRVQTRHVAEVQKNVIKTSTKGPHLFSGIQSTAMSAFPVGFAYIFGYNKGRQYLRRLFPNLSENAENILGGAAAELSCNLIRGPFEIVKQQMQVGLGRSLHETITGIYKAQGIRGFYTGVLPLLFRDVPYSMTFMPVYEQVKKRGHPTDWKWTLLSSATAALVASFITQPMDVLKTRLMTSRQSSKTLTSTLSHIISSEGITGLYRGFPYRLVSALYFGMVFFSVYEWARIGLEKYIG